MAARSRRGRLPAAAYPTVSRRGSHRGSLRGVVRIPGRSANGLFQVRRRAVVSLSVRRSVVSDPRSPPPTCAFACVRCVGSGRRAPSPPAKVSARPSRPRQPRRRRDPRPAAARSPAAATSRAPAESERCCRTRRPSTGSERDDEDGARGAHGWGARGRFGGFARRGHVERARDAPSAAAHRRRPPPSSRRADRVTYQPDLKSSARHRLTRAAAHHFSFPLARLAENI